jgi:hypothetical protein
MSHSFLSSKPPEAVPGYKAKGTPVTLEK